MRRRVGGFVLAILVAPVASASVVDGPVSYGDHDYYLLSPQPWLDAEIEATALGGHLVAVNSQAEQDFLVGFLSPWGGSNWIGFTDEAIEGEWVWLNGDPVTYTNWAPSEPNNTNGNEHYGVIEMAWGGLWNDLPGDRVHRGIVEVEIPDVPASDRRALVTLALLLMLGSAAFYAKTIGCSRS